MSEMKPVAMVFGRHGDSYGCGHIIEVDLLITPGTELPIGTRLYNEQTVADILKEAVRICKSLDEEARDKEDRLACGAECAAAIEDLAMQLNLPLENTGGADRRIT